MTRAAEQYREDTTAIEVSFAAPVNLSSEQQRRLVELLDEVCRDYEAHHPDRTMWVFGVGGKLLCHPMMLSDDEPIPIDMSVLSVECFERENYDFSPASVGRNAERQDAEERLGPKDEHAVGAAETPTSSPIPKDRHDPINRVR